MRPSRHVNDGKGNLPGRPGPRSNVRVVRRAATTASWACAQTAPRTDGLTAVLPQYYALPMSGVNGHSDNPACGKRRPQRVRTRTRYCPKRQPVARYSCQTSGWGRGMPRPPRGAATQYSAVENRMPARAREYLPLGAEGNRRAPQRRVLRGEETKRAMSLNQTTMVVVVGKKPQERQTALYAVRCNAARNAKPSVHNRAERQPQRRRACASLSERQERAIRNPTERERFNGIQPRLVIRQQPEKPLSRWWRRERETKCVMWAMRLRDQSDNVPPLSQIIDVQCWCASLGLLRQDSVNQPAARQKNQTQPNASKVAGMRSQ